MIFDKPDSLPLRMLRIFFPSYSLGGYLKNWVKYASKESPAVGLPKGGAKQGKTPSLRIRGRRLILLEYWGEEFTSKINIIRA